MDARSWSSWRRALCCVLVAVAGAAVADEKPRGLEGGEKVNVSFNLLVSWNEGATTRIAGWGPYPLRVGEAMRALGLQRFAFGADGGAEGCSSGVATLPVQTIFDQYGYALAWMADASVVEASTGHLVLSASWKRFTRGPGGEAVESAHESIPRLSLREGERALLDYAVPPANNQQRCARNYLLELTAEVMEDPVFADRQIVYDLWLVHETAGGLKETAHTQLIAGQGERVPFAFAKQKLAAVTGGAGSDQKLQVAISGHVRGRIRRDGPIELALGSERALSYVAPDGSNDGSVADAGEKNVRVQPGEGIRVELPPPSQGPTGGDARAPSMTRDLAGHSFALILTAKPVS